MSNYTIRLLTTSDYNKYYVLINNFQKTTFSEDEFINMINKIQDSTEIYVIEYNNDLVATGTILYEHKFIHNISLYAHIEDICVKEEYRKNGFGKILVNYLVDETRRKGCYKTLLDCNEKLENFYSKNEFKKNGIQMVIYF